MQKLKARTSQLRNDLKAGPTFSKLRIIVFIAVFALVGGVTLLLSFALTPQPGSQPGQRVSNLSGELEVLHADDWKLDKQGKPDPNPKHWVAEYFYNLTAADHQTYKLVFPGRGPDLLTHSKITVSGVKEGNSIKVASDGGNDLKVNYKALPHHSPRKVAVILLNWSNDPATPATPEQIKQQVFTSTNSVANYYKESSYNIRTLLGKADPAGDVFGWYTIPLANDGVCRYSEWASQARDAAAAAGVDLSGYDNYVYTWPYGPPYSGCGWGGIAQIGGNTAYINGVSNGNIPQTAVAHELGHNFGVDHAHSKECYDSSGFRVTLSKDCTDYEYGDPLDVMGYCCSSYYQMNNEHKTVLSWFAPSNTQTVSASGDYTIAPLDFVSSGVQSLVIPGVTKGRVYTPPYYFEFRQPSLFDVYGPNNPGTSPPYDGVLIRQGQGTISTILDATPNNSNYGDGGDFDYGLQAGRTFSDTNAGFSITTLSTSPAGAVVRVTLSGKAQTNNAACSPVNVPAVVKPGSSFSASMSVKNTGTASWSTSDYQLGSAQVSQDPYPWHHPSGPVYFIAPSATWGISNLSLPASVSANGTMTLAGNLTAPTTPGAYEFNWRMYQKSQDQWFGTSCSTTINISDDTAPPSIPTNLAVASTTPTSVSLSWGGSTDNVGVAYYRVYRSSGRGSSALAGYSYTTSFSDSGLSNKQTYSYYATAVDTSGNESAPSNTISIRPQ